MANVTKLKRDEMLAYINQLKQLHTDDESIKALNEIENHLTDKKFGLVFEEHTEEADEKLKDYIPVLCADTERVICKDDTLPYNFIIEGDNLHALHLLEKTHRGKVDCIYIDPPYNTGAHDWKYNNDYVDDSDLYPHSKWLSMMKIRLMSAKKILNPKTGVMIITIDEHEVHHLRTMIEEIFQNAYIQMVTIVINPKGVARGKFARVEENAIFVFMPEAKLCSWKDNMLTEIKKSSKVRWASLLRSGTDARREDNKSLFYPILIDRTNKKVVKALGPLLPLDIHPNLEEKIDGYDVSWPIRKDNSEGRWMLSPDTLNSLIELGYVSLGKYDEKRKTWPISYLNEKTRKQIESGEIKIKDHDSSGCVEIEYVGDMNHEIRTVWNRSLHNAGNYGTDLITNILGKSGSFTFPKSIYAERDCIGMIVKDNPNAIVVDFFAGSGTTLHAINLLNYDDCGNRKCILVTNNECSEEDEKKFKMDNNVDVIDKNSESWKKFENEHGIAKSVTWIRSKNSIYGFREDGSSIPGEIELLTSSEQEVKRVYKMLAFSLEEYKERKSYLDSLGKDIIKTSLLKKNMDFIICTDTSFAILFNSEKIDEFIDELNDNEPVKTIYLLTKDKKIYDSLCMKLESNINKVFESSINKHIISTGFNTNLKYYKCDWIERRPEDYLLSNALSLHIKEMIELQNFINLDNKKYILILTKNDFKKYILNNDKKHLIQKVWVNQNIVFDSNEIKELKKYKFKYIPKEFFGQELKEVAE